MTTKPEILDSTSINAKVDFSLTKDDLTEMVLEERFEALEDMLNDTNKQLDKLREQMGELEVKHNEHIVAVAKKCFSSRIKSAEKFLGNKATHSTTNFGGRHCVSSTVYFSYEEYELGFNSQRRRKVEKTESCYGWSVCKSVTFYVSSNTKEVKQNKHHAKIEHGQWSATRTFTNEEMAKMPFVKKLVAIDDKRKELMKESTLLRTELSNLETSGKRARAKMVKALLSASTQGQQLLAKMPKMNHKLLTS
jgi:predicted  nucleic acid-binding Zn-ribbon protein